MAHMRMGSPYAYGTAHTRTGKIRIWDGTTLILLSKAEDIATEKSVALKGHKYVIDTAGVTKSHRLVIGVTKSHRLVIDTAGVTL